MTDRQTAATEQTPWGALGASILIFAALTGWLYDKNGVPSHPLIPEMLFETIMWICLPGAVIAGAVFVKWELNKYRLDGESHGR
jgi:hypothetical protein